MPSLHLYIAINITIFIIIVILFHDIFWHREYTLIFMVEYSIVEYYIVLCAYGIVFWCASSQIIPLSDTTQWNVSATKRSIRRHVRGLMPFRYVFGKEK